MRNWSHVTTAYMLLHELISV